jgi:hypothetical protein
MFFEGRAFRAGVKGQADVLAIVDEAGLEDLVSARMPELNRRLHSAWWIEAKTGSGKQTEFQKSFEADVKRRGMGYLVCRDSRELDGIFRKYLMRRGA